MTLQQLKYALTIADCGSMNEAAKQLFISQPSLSETMKELETEIGLDIFLRSNRGIVITPEGEEFLGYARQVTEQFGLLQSKYIDKKVKEKFSVSGFFQRQFQAQYRLPYKQHRRAPYRFPVMHRYNRHLFL